jgi:signal peptidase I
MTATKPQEDLQKAHRRRKSKESFLETLESIIVAFILAFIFRAFIVEAFVIPTGSMAPTLYGAHAEFRCRDCGYDFAVGGDSRLEYGPLCPNCFLPQYVPDTPKSRADKPKSYAGDRILVLKFLYDFQPPQRWDVIVFRNPNQPDQNYIKRLVALPGETLELVRGDVTINGRIVQKTDKAQEALWMLVHDTRHKATRRGWHPRWVADKEWQPRDVGYKLEKPPARDQTAWLAYQHRDPEGRISNIADFYAYNSGSDVRRLGTVLCTDLSLRTEVTAGQPSSVVVIELRAYKDDFRFELTADGGDHPTRIFLNDKVVAQAPAGVLPVGQAACVQAANVDHKLMLLVDGKRVTPICSLEATPEGDVTYTPTPLTPKENRLFDPHPLKPEEYRLLNPEPLSREEFRLLNPEPPWPGKERLFDPKPLSPDEFDRLIRTALGEEELRIFDSKPLTRNERRLLDYRKKGDSQSLAASARIGVRGGTAALAYLRVDRDVYYLNYEPSGLNASGHGTEGHPFSLHPGEYFVLGDNSPMSFDARFWPLREDFRPVVPQRNLVGKAFFVYWPSAGWRYYVPYAPDLTGFRLVH